MAKVNLKLYLSISLLTFSFMVAKAQMVNEGNMIIEKGTNDVSTFFDFWNKEHAEFINDDSFYVKKDYLNEGKVTHDGEGTTYFEGIEESNNPKIKIDGGIDTYFKDVVFNNTVGPADAAAFDLKGAINVEGKATFNKGIINNKATGGVFTFLEGGTSEKASDESYVNGKVEKKGNTPFEFPVGADKKEVYRYASISAPKEVAALVTSEYFYKDNNAASNYPFNKKDSSIAKVDKDEYWEIKGSNNQDLILTLSWSDQTTPDKFLDNPKSIRIAYWDDTNKKWTNLQGVLNEGARTISAPVSGDGIFTLALADKVTVDKELKVHNLITLNGDDVNDHLKIGFINNGTTAEKLGLKIYNRWGVLVYESDDYQNEEDDHKFYGYSNAKRVYGKDNQLPSGTYFYVLDCVLKTRDGKKLSGKKMDYLYIAKELETR